MLKQIKDYKVSDFVEKAFLSVLCGLVIATSVISINVTAVEEVSYSYSDSSSADIQTVAAGSEELSDSESHEINVYLTTILDDETLSYDESSRTNTPYEEKQNAKHLKNSPLTGDVEFVLPVLILMILSSAVLLIYFMCKRYL